MPQPRPLHLLLTLSVLALAACGENVAPTQPETPGGPAPTAPQFALASNTWAPRAPSSLILSDLGVFPNAAGQSIVYSLGGTTSEGGAYFPISAYNPATDTWTGTGDGAHVLGFSSNGVGKIGNKLFISGGDFGGVNPTEFTAATWAYDPAAHRFIRKADIPKATAHGVTGVIGGQLYVLPGDCVADPLDPHACQDEATRRLFRYDPPTNTWISRRWAPHFHAFGAAGVINGKFYVAGGLDHFNPTAAFDVYDPATNTWRTLAPLPTAGQAIGAALGSKLFVIVGLEASDAPMSMTARPMPGGPGPRPPGTMTASFGSPSMAVPTFSRWAVTTRGSPPTTASCTRHSTGSFCTVDPNGRPLRRRPASRGSRRRCSRSPVATAARPASCRSH